MRGRVSGPLGHMLDVLYKCQTLSHLVVPDVLGAPPHGAALREERAVQAQAEGGQAAAGVGLVREEAVEDACQIGIDMCASHGVGTLQRILALPSASNHAENMHKHTLIDQSPRTPTHDVSPIAVGEREGHLPPRRPEARVACVRQA